MRTTLDLDPAVVSAARAKARADGVSLGRAMSELALQGLRGSGEPSRKVGGFPVMKGDPDHPVTDELVAEHRDDA